MFVLTVIGCVINVILAIKYVLYYALHAYASPILGYFLGDPMTAFITTIQCGSILFILKVRLPEQDTRESTQAKSESSSAISRALKGLDAGNKV